MGKSFKDAKTSGDDGNRWEDDLPFTLKDIREIAKDEYKAIRLVGYCEPFMRFWVPTEASKAYDPYKTRAKTYPAVCSDFDPVEEVFSGDQCLYRKARYKHIDDEGNEQWGRLKPSKNYLIFFIDRERQEERAGIPLKKKVKLAKKFSDIQCATVPTAFAKSVQSAIEMYAKKVKKEVDPTDPDDGFDLFFRYDKEASAEAKYKIQLGDPSPLSKEERKQIEVIPETINIFPKDSPQKIKDSLERSGYVLVEKGESPEEALANKRSSKKRAVKEGVELTDDDDEDEVPRRKKPKKEEPEETFEDEDGDLDLDEDGDEDEDLDFDDEDEEEEEKPAPKKAKDEDEDDEDDDDEDFDFDDDDDDFGDDD